MTEQKTTSPELVVVKPTVLAFDPDDWDEADIKTEEKKLCRIENPDCEACQ